MDSPSSQTRAPLEQLFLCDGVLQKGKHAGKQCRYPLIGRRSPQQEPSIDCPRCHKEWSIQTLQSEIGAREEGRQVQQEEEAAIKETVTIKRNSDESLRNLQEALHEFLKIQDAKSRLVSLNGNHGPLDNLCAADRARTTRQLIELTDDHRDAIYEFNPFNESYFTIEWYNSDRREHYRVQIMLGSTLPYVVATIQGDNQGESSFELQKLHWVRVNGPYLFIDGDFSLSLPFTGAQGTICKERLGA